MDNETAIRLIKIYASYSLLWDTRRKEYHNNNLREDVWDEIAKKLEQPKAVLKVKMKSLLSSYRRERNREKTRNVTGCGRKKAYKSKWFAYGAFSFLHDRNNPIDAVEAVGSTEADTSTTQEKSLHIEHIAIEGTLEPNSDPLQDIKLEEPTNDLYYLQVINTPKSPQSSSSQQSTRIQKRIINRRKRPYEPVPANSTQRLESTVSNVINSPQNRQEASLQAEDEFHMFALSVAAQLRQLPLHVAITTQSKIQSMLSEARLSSIFLSSSTQPSIAIVKTENTSDE